METWVALMGKRNTPTDGVEDYCTLLGEALARRGVDLVKARMDWAENGWSAALQNLKRQSEEWRGWPVLLQYTALAWSRRGFPFGALRTLDVVARSGARTGVIFHEFRRQEAGRGLIQPLRAACQDFVPRRLSKRAALSVFTVPVRKVPWLQAGQPATFIPIGANVPEVSEVGTSGSLAQAARERTVAVFCFTSSPNRELEIGDMIYAAQSAQRAGQPIHLRILGRGSREILPEIEMRLAGSGVHASATGILPAAEISRALAQSDALLFVSGQLSQTRGSALAGVACGLPIVGYGGEVEDTPLAEAGLQLAPYRNREALGAALALVMADANLRARLRLRSFDAQRKYFSWDAIAEQFVHAFGENGFDADCVESSDKKPLESARSAR